MTREIFDFEGFTLNTEERTLTRAGGLFAVTPKAFDVLVYLLRNPGRILTKDELLKEIWPDTFVEEVNLAVNISTLRKVLGEDPQDRRFIVTVPGRGYRFVAQVNSREDSNPLNANVRTRENLREGSAETRVPAENGIAKAALQKALAINAQLEGAHGNLSKILLAEHQPQLALNEIQKESGEWERWTGEALVYHDLGRTQDSDAAVAKLITKHPADSPYQIAEIYAYRGQSDRAFEWLERAYQDRDPGLNQLKSDPLLNSLRKDPRYESLLKRMRLA
jgi:DNA-binding winged helix-turn-helix (wHTH) protein